MKNIINLLTSFFLILMLHAQYAEPAVTGAHYVPNEIVVGDTSLLTISFVNSGSTAIPKGSIEITISTAPLYYVSDSTVQPHGPASSLFDWTYITKDVWRGKKC